jgi:hypothetical protein
MKRLLYGELRGRSRLVVQGLYHHLVHVVGQAFESWLLLIRGSQTRGEALISLCKVPSMVLR